MARIRSWMYFDRPISRRSREASVTPRCRRLQEKAELEVYSVKLDKANMVKSVGSGYLPAQASVAGLAVEVKHAAGVDRGMIELKG